MDDNLYKSSNIFARYLIYFDPLPANSLEVKVCLELLSVKTLPTQDADGAHAALLKSFEEFKSLDPSISSFFETIGVLLPTERLIGFTADGASTTTRHCFCVVHCTQAKVGH